MNKKSQIMLLIIIGWLSLGYFTASAKSPLGYIYKSHMEHAEKKCKNDEGLLRVAATYQKTNRVTLNVYCGTGKRYIYQIQM